MKTAIEVPSHVAFVNIKDGSVFFDCTPAEARLASRFITKIRKDRDAGVMYKGLREKSEAQMEAAMSSRARWRKIPISKSSSLQMEEKGELTIEALNMMFAVAESSNYFVTGVVIHPQTYVDVRNWGKSAYDEVPPEEVLYAGIFCRIWTADIFVSSKKIKPYQIILVSSVEGTELDARRIDKPKVWKFRWDK